MGSTRRKTGWIIQEQRKALLKANEKAEGKMPRILMTKTANLKCEEKRLTRRESFFEIYWKKDKRKLCVEVIM